MIRTLGGHPATIDQLRRRARLRAFIAWQLDHAPDCETCGIDCGGRCASRPRCGAGCGAVVASEGAICLSCISAA
jgi:hypothetical protein